MNLRIDPTGTVHGVYAEAIDLGALGIPSIRRASHVEPDERGQWWADLSPVGGPMLGPFPSRTPALDAEIAWLDEHWRPGPHAPPPTR
jgi:hypothetical protein